MNCLLWIDVFRAPRAGHGKVQYAGNGRSLVKDSNAAVARLRGFFKGSDPLNLLEKC